MAVANTVSSQLKLVLYDGEDVMSGEPIYKTKSFNSIKTTANHDQLYAIANAFASLQERLLFKIERQDRAEIRQN